MDKDAAAWITKASAPKDAIGNYLHGRAYFLQKQYKKAKTHLDDSNRMLNAGVSPRIKGMLESEIPLMLAIISSDGAQKLLDQQSAPSQPDNSVGSNTANNN